MVDSKTRHLDSKLLALEPLPSTENIVIREEEVNYYQSRLKSQKVVIIEGAPGVGKSLLGALIAKRQAKPTFWMTFRKGVNDTVVAVIWELAKFLAHQGNEELWHFLHEERQSRRPSYELSLKISFLAKSLEEGEYVLCFDDFHVVNENEEVVSFFEDFRNRVRYVTFLLIGVIIMSRHRPRLVGAVTPKALGGMKRSEARQLVDRSGAELGANIFARLYQRTEGVPVFLRLFIAWVHNTQSSMPAMEDFIRNMPNRREIRNYLLRNFYETLNKAEQEVVKALAVFRVRITRDTAEYVAEMAKVEEFPLVVEELVNKHALEESEDGIYIFLHSLVRDYLLTLLKKGTATALHARAGEVFEEKDNFLEAGYHWFEAQKYAESVKLLLEKSDELMDTRYAGALLDLLLQFNETMVDKATWKSILTCRGDIRERIGAYTEAIEDFKRVLDICETAHGRAEVHRRLGWTYQRISQFDKSKGEFQAGIDSLGRQQRDPELPRLYFQLAFVHQQLAEYPRAIELALKALDLLDESASPRDVAKALNILGASYYGQSKHSEALEVYEQALVINERINNLFGVHNNLGNIGNVYARLGQFDKALEYLNRSLQMAQTCGYLTSEAVSHANIAHIYLMQMQLPQAMESIHRAIAIEERIGDVQAAAGSRVELGVICFQQGDWAFAESEWNLALGMFVQIQDRDGEAKVLGNLGILCFLQGNIDRALEVWERGLAVAQESGDYETIAGFEGNILGVQILRGDLQKALNLAEQALEHTQESQNPYLICGMMGNLGQIYERLGNYPQALEYLKKAEKLAKDTQVVICLPEIFGILAEVHLKTGECLLALACCQEGRRIAQESGNVMAYAQVTRVLGQYYAQAQDTVSAEECFSESLATFEKVESICEKAQVLLHFGIMLQKKGDYQRADDMLNQALGMFRKLGAKREIEQIQNLLESDNDT